MAATFLKAPPQPGDGAWLLRTATNIRRDETGSNGHVQSFLRDAADHHDYGPAVGADAPDEGKSQASFWRSGMRWQERAPAEATSFNGQHESACYESQRTAPAHTRQAPTELPTFLRRPSEIISDNAPAHPPTYDEDMPTTLRPLPPHRRNRDSPSLLPGFDIVQRLASDHGVKISDPVPTTKIALAAHLVSNGDNSVGWADDEWKLEQSSPSASTSKRGQPWGHRGRGRDPSRASERGAERGRGRAGRGRGTPRESRWPRNSELKADPTRWDIKWDDESSGFCSSVDSVCANAGFGDSKSRKKQPTRWDSSGIDPNSPWELTDWTGTWAPAPVDWDARPGFRDGQSVAKIEKWMEKTEEEMCGKAWHISVEDVQLQGVTYAFAPGPEDTRVIQGDPAPRHWVPVVIAGLAPQTFWTELIKSNTPVPMDEDDLVNVLPWWQTYQVHGGCFLQHCQHTEEKGVDPQEETGEERIARENDHGSAHHTANRKRKELAKKEAERDRGKKAQEKMRHLTKDEVARMKENCIKPGIKLYVRRAQLDDVPRLRDIYNSYVEHSACTPETQHRTNYDMRQRLDDIRSNMMPFLVACERTKKTPNRRDGLVLPDKVVGFAFADDYCDMQSIYRFTAEMEVFVDMQYGMKGVAKCLLDKLMVLLDPTYIEKGGFAVVGDDLDATGASRRISNVIVNLPYEKDDSERLEWVSRWLMGGLGFEKSGDLQGVGLKKNQIVNLAIFQRKTGEHIDPKLPPVRMNYPKK